MCTAGLKFRPPQIPKVPTAGSAVAHMAGKMAKKGVLVATEAHRQGTPFYMEYPAGSLAKTPRRARRRTGWRGGGCSTARTATYRTNRPTSGRTWRTGNRRGKRETGGAGGSVEWGGHGARRDLPPRHQPCCGTSLRRTCREPGAYARGRAMATAGRGRRPRPSQVEAHLLQLWPPIVLDFEVQ